MRLVCSEVKCHSGLETISVPVGLKTATLYPKLGVLATGLL